MSVPGAYATWAALVQRTGGRVVQGPTGDHESDWYNPLSWGTDDAYNPALGRDVIPSVLSAAYPAEIWVPKSNAHLFPQPDEYSKDGRTGYYHAPRAVQEMANDFSNATPEEEKLTANDLMNRWGIPNFLRSVNNYVKTVASTVVVVGVVLGAWYLWSHSPRSRRRRV